MEDDSALAIDWAEETDSLIFEEAVAYRGGDYAGALRALDKYLQKHPKRSDAWLSRAHLLYLMGFISDARKCTEQALSINPDFASAMAFKAFLLASTGNPEEAEAIAKKAYSLSTKNIYVLNTLGVVYYTIGAYDVARDFFSQCLIFQNDFSPTMHNLALVLFKEGNFQKALEIITTSISAEVSNYLGWNIKGVVLAKLGKLEDAHEAFIKATRIRPNYDTAWFNRALAAAKLGRFDDAIKDYTICTELSYNNPVPHYNRANLMIRKRGSFDPDKIIEDYQKACLIDPSFTEAWNNMGNIYAVKEKAVKASRCYKRAIECSENVWQPYFNSGVLFVGTLLSTEGLDTMKISREALPDAFEYFSQVLQKDNNNPYARLNITACVLLSGELDSAEQILGELENVKAVQDHVWYNKGWLLARRRDYAGARRVLETILTSDPALAVEIERLLDAIRLYDGDQITRRNTEGSGATSKPPPTDSIPHPATEPQVPVFPLPAFSMPENPFRTKNLSLESHLPQSGGNTTSAHPLSSSSSSSSFSSSSSSIHPSSPTTEVSSLQPVIHFLSFDKLAFFPDKDFELSRPRIEVVDRISSLKERFITNILTLYELQKNRLSDKLSEMEEKTKAIKFQEQVIVKKEEELKQKQQDLNNLLVNVESEKLRLLDMEKQLAKWNDTLRNQEMLLTKEEEDLKRREEDLREQEKKLLFEISRLELRKSDYMEWQNKLKEDEIHLGERDLELSQWEKQLVEQKRSQEMYGEVLRKREEELKRLEAELKQKEAEQEQKREYLFRLKAEIELEKQKLRDERGINYETAKKEEKEMIIKENEALSSLVPPLSVSPPQEVPLSHTPKEAVLSPPAATSSPSSSPSSLPSPYPPPPDKLAMTEEHSSTDGSGSAAAAGSDKEIIVLAKLEVQEPEKKEADKIIEGPMKEKEIEKVAKEERKPDNKPVETASAPVITMVPLTPKPATSKARKEIKWANIADIHPERCPKCSTVLEASFMCCPSCGFNEFSKVEAKGKGLKKAILIEPVQSIMRGTGLASIRNRYQMVHEYECSLCGEVFKTAENQRPLNVLCPHCNQVVMLDV